MVDDGTPDSSPTEPAGPVEPDEAASAVADEVPAESFVGSDAESPAGETDPPVELLRARVDLLAAWASQRSRLVAARWPSLTWATNGVISTALAVVLMFTLVAALLMRPMPAAVKVASAPSPTSSASATPSPTPSPSIDNDWQPAPTDATLLWNPDWTPPPASASPTERATLPANAREGHVVATAKCVTDYFGEPAVSGETIWGECRLGVDAADRAPFIGGFDATKASLSYRISHGTDDTRVVQLFVDHGVWFSDYLAFSCMVDPCGPVVPARVQKADPASGNVVFTMEGARVAADGLGYVWAKADSETLLRIDPETYATSSIPWHSGSPMVACGQLWGQTPLVGGLDRVDPNSGAVLATIAGSFSSLGQAADGCWGIETITDAQTLQVTRRFVRFGRSGIEAASTTFDVQHWLYLMDGRFWLSPLAPYDRLQLQQLDPATWQPAGPLWVVLRGSASIVAPFAAGGSIWAHSESAAEGLVRLDIPLGPQLVPAPLPSPSASPTAVPTPEPTAAPSPSPQDAGTPAPPEVPSPAAS